MGNTDSAKRFKKDIGNVLDMAGFSDKLVTLDKIPNAGIEIPLWESYTSFKMVPNVFISTLNVGNFLKVFEDKINYNTQNDRKHS